MTDTHNHLISGSFNVQAVERVVYGQPAGTAVLAECARGGFKRVFVTTTRSLTQLENGPLQRLVRALGERHVGTFSAIGAHSPREDVAAGANQARAAGADLLVAVGGGSVIDATKAMLLCLWLDLDSAAAMEPYRGGGTGKVVAPAEPIRMVSVSTTLSASEFTSSAGITDTRNHTKQMFGHRLCAPRLVVLDPAATLDTPDWLLFCTGIRAVDHAVEGYCQTLANPATEALSLQGLRLLARALPRIKREPSDLAARLEAQFGMWQAILPGASGVPMGASHGIGYVLGAVFDVPHGHTSCIMLPWVMRWNNSANADRQALIANAMGHPGEDAGDVLDRFIRGLDMPRTLSDVKIGREHFDRIAQQAMGTPWVPRNPRPIPTPAEVREILELAA